MKGIILAGGTGSRLFPLTKIISKQMLPVYDKPAIFYPLSTLIHAGVKDVLVISSPTQIKHIENLLGKGEEFGISIHYAVQQKPLGIAQALTIGSDFTGDENFWLILGDNLFHGLNFGQKLLEITNANSATIFAYRVKDPSNYGVVKFDPISDIPTEIIEKPLNYISPWAIPGLYFLNKKSIKIAESLPFSSRGELEITDVLNEILKQAELNVVKVSRGNAWFDLGTFDSLLKAANFVEMLQSNQGLRIGDPADAYRNFKIH